MSLHLHGNSMEQNETGTGLLVPVMHPFLVLDAILLIRRCISCYTPFTNRLSESDFIRFTVNPFASAAAAAIDAIPSAGSHHLHLEVDMAVSAILAVVATSRPAATRGCMYYISSQY